MQIPHLDTAYRRFKQEGVDFVGITKEPKSTIDPFIEKMKDT